MAEDTTPVPVLNHLAGTDRPAASGATTDLVNPATGEVHRSAPRSGPSDTDAACTAAETALARWSLTTPAERQRALLRIADAVEEHADALVAAEVGDTGKPPEQFRTEELPAVIDTFRYFAGAARQLPGAAAAEYTEGRTSVLRREPVGVCAQITPWNYPLMMAAWKVAPALAAGNTTVLKPADTTPSSASLLARIAAEHLPPGVLNVVCGDRDTGRSLTAHPVPRLVAVPVVTVQPFTDEAEALRLANGVRFGLAASVWTGDHARAMRATRALHTGSRLGEHPWHHGVGDAARRGQALRLRQRSVPRGPAGLHPGQARHAVRRRLPGAALPGSFGRRAALRCPPVRAPYRGRGRRPAPGPEHLSDPGPVRRGRAARHPTGPARRPAPRAAATSRSGPVRRTG